MKSRILLSCLFIMPILMYGQTLKRDSIGFNQRVVNYSLDTSGNIFISFEGGSITKYSADLDSIFTYSPLKLGDTKLLEAGTGLIIFAFYDFFQEYLLTDRFLTRPTRSKFSNAEIGYIELATQSLDNNIWLIDNSNFRLLKYNVQLGIIETETFLNTVIESADNNFTFIKEYQNQVFLIDENSGIYVFDNIGNFSKFIPAKTNSCGFKKNDLYYIEEEKLITTNIYNGTNTSLAITETGVIGVLQHKFITYFVKNNALIRTY